MKSKSTLLAATLFAASAFAVSAVAEEETVTVDVFSMDTSFTLDASETTDTDALAALGVSADSVTADSVTTYLGTAETGVHTGSYGGYYMYVDYSTRIAWTVSGTNTNTDSYLAIVISVEDLLAEAGLDVSSVGSLSLAFSSYSISYSNRGNNTGGSNANSKNLPSDDEDEDVSASSLVSISDESAESNSDGDALTAWVVSGGEAAAVALAADDDGYTITISDVSEITSVVLIFSLGEGNTNSCVYTTCSVYDITAAITVVPEPSAFGIFAGIAVLALAVSRRTRRSRKIA